MNKKKLRKKRLRRWIKKGTNYNMNTNINNVTSQPEGNIITETTNTLFNEVKNAPFSKSTTRLKFGFIGVGLGGTSIGNECGDIHFGDGTKASDFPYKAILINTS